jgi:hypothetical protein
MAWPTTEGKAVFPVLTVPHQGGAVLQVYIPNVQVGKLADSDTGQDSLRICTC